MKLRKHMRLKTIEDNFFQSFRSHSLKIFRETPQIRNHIIRIS